MMKNVMEPLLTVSDLKKILRCSYSNCYNLVAQGQIRHIRVGAGNGGIRFAPEMVAEFLKRKEEGGEKNPPAVAFTQVVARAHNLEARLAGSALVGNNLGARLDAARKDALYAQLLFLFLGVPGAVLAALLTWVIGSAGAERRRREQALLRMRGAPPGRIVRLAAGEAAVVGVTGVAVGLGGAVLGGRLALGSARFGGTFGQSLIWVGVASLAGLALAFLTVLVPAWRDARTLTVREARVVLGEGVAVNDVGIFHTV